MKLMDCFASEKNGWPEHVDNCIAAEILPKCGETNFVDEALVDNTIIAFPTQASSKKRMSKENFTMKNVSVIIPTYNRSHLVCDAIKSVMHQDVKDCVIEIIVVDDGSTDDTRQQVSSFGGNIKYIFQENQGPGVARNRGIEESTGEWIAFLDSDDLWLPDKLSLQFKVLESFPQYKAVHSNFYSTRDGKIIIEKGLEFWSDHSVYNKNINWSDFYSDKYNSVDLGITNSNKSFDIYAGNIFNTLMGNACAACWTLLVRKDCLVEKIRFHEKISIREDYWFICKLCEHNDIIFMDHPTVENRGDAEFRLTDGQEDKALECYVEVCSKIYVPSVSKNRPDDNVISKYYSDAVTKLLKLYLKEGSLSKASELMNRNHDYIGVNIDSSYLLYRLASFLPFNVINRFVRLKRLVSKNSRVTAHASNSVESEARSMELHTRILKGVAGMDSLRNQWEDLHSYCDLWSRFEWYHAYVTNLAVDSESIYFIQVIAGEKTIAIVPAEISRQEIKPLGNLKVLCLAFHSHIPLMDFPLNPHVDPAMVVEQLLKAFQDLPVHWDVIRWSRVMDSSNAIHVARSASYHSIFIRSSVPCNFIDTSNSFEELFNNLSSKQRNNLKASRKRLSKTADWQVTKSASEVDFVPSYEAFLRIESSGWKGESGEGTGIQMNSGTLKFYASLLRQINPDFVPEVILLKCGPQAIAGQFMIRTHGIMYGIKMGYDECYAKLSPGKILMEEILRSACDSTAIKGVNCVSNALWSHQWKPKQEETFDVIVFRNRAFGVMFGRYLYARKLAKSVATWVKGKCGSTT